MADNLKGIEDLLEKLSNAHGVSGREWIPRDIPKEELKHRSVRDILKEELGRYTDKVEPDGLGNLIATKNKNGNGPSVMLCAHMDEVGLSTSYITDDGFLHFIGIGRWFDQTLLNQRVIVHGDKGPLLGVIGSKPAHLLEEEEEKEPIKIKDMFIDIGTCDEKEAQNIGVEIGTPITIDREFSRLKINLNNREALDDRTGCEERHKKVLSLVTGKALDDRAGCAVMIEAMKRTKTKATVYAVGSVQEEFTSLGAQTASFGLKPNVAIAIETEYAGDHPGIKKKEAHLELGKGPSVTVVDEGLITPPNVLQWIKDTAEECDIQCQYYVGKNGSTDAAGISFTREGIPSGVVSVVTRYMHTPVEVLDLNDLDKAAELIARMLETVGDQKYNFQDSRTK